MEKLTIVLEPIATITEFEKLQDTIEAHNGVGEVAAFFKTNKLVIQFNLFQTSAAELKQLITDLGHKIISSTTEH
ncbi:hypothetical protein [Lapidilactobacillus bayanensis]|uniref:hypothetical protein n=1 Tax=Lapidilactobacillus bayanensis TaxID=2485998 RepID=UPI000F7782A1|nr:hypothetical protein [Lapidilactobacillus bayanensis]